MPEITQPKSRPIPKTRGSRKKGTLNINTKIQYLHRQTLKRKRKFETGIDNAMLKAIEDVVEEDLTNTQDADNTITNILNKENVEGEGQATKDGASTQANPICIKSDTTIPTSLFSLVNRHNDSYQPLSELTTQDNTTTYESSKQSTPPVNETLQEKDESVEPGRGNEPEGAGLSPRQLLPTPQTLKFPVVAEVVQLAEQGPCKAEIEGSSPSLSLPSEVIPVASGDVVGPRRVKSGALEFQVGNKLSPGAPRKDSFTEEFKRYLRGRMPDPENGQMVTRMKLWVRAVYLACLRGNMAVNPVMIERVDGPVVKEEKKDIKVKISFTKDWD